MTDFRPTTLSPEALKVWDEAEANIQASLQRIRELIDPVRKPTEPGLKEQALESLRFLGGNSRDVDTIRRALEQLDTPAARWGADQELEACCEWLSTYGHTYEIGLRAARRPKPPSLKEQALEALDEERAEMSIVNYKTIRAVLEQLDD